MNSTLCCSRIPEGDRRRFWKSIAALGGGTFALLTASCDYIDTPTRTSCWTTTTRRTRRCLSSSTARWQAVSFRIPLAPGASSDPQSTVSCSTNTAWVVLAPGWDPTSATPPASFVLLESRLGFAVDLGKTVHIPVDNQNFAGNCATGDPISQSDADFITQLVFPSLRVPSLRRGELHHDDASADAGIAVRPPPSSRESFARLVGALLRGSVSPCVDPRGRAGRASGGPRRCAFDFMNLLAQHDLHDIENESWNAYGQFTYISSCKLPFSAPYTNANGSNNSLVAGLRAELHGHLHALLRLAPLARRPRPTSSPRSSPSGRSRGSRARRRDPELRAPEDRIGDPAALPLADLLPPDHRVRRRSRRARRRTRCSSGPSSTAGGSSCHRQLHDPRLLRQELRHLGSAPAFFNMAFMTYASWDFPSDARGYSWGGAAELYWDDWALRIGRITPPQDPNQLADRLPVLEVLRRRSSSSSTTTRSSDRPARCASSATETTCSPGDSTTPSRPSRPTRTRTPPRAEALQLRIGQLHGAGPLLGPKAEREVGIGINVEQYVARRRRRLRPRDVLRRADRGRRFQLGRSVALLGAVAKGSALAPSLRRRRASGVGIELDLGHPRQVSGDGRRRRLRWGRPSPAGRRGGRRSVLQREPPEGDWLAADYQHIWNPGFNADRGPRRHRRLGPCGVLEERFLFARWGSRANSSAWRRGRGPTPNSKRRALPWIGCIRRRQAAGGPSWTPFDTRGGLGGAVALTTWYAHDPLRGCRTADGSQRLTAVSDEALAGFLLSPRPTTELEALPEPRHAARCHRK